MLVEALQIPGIELGPELGHSAYSVVYRALQGAKPCAVKVARARGRWTRWAYREAVALARVHHPGLPAVIEVGEVDDLPYLVMELVVGKTLAERLRDGPLEGDEALGLVACLVEALGAVHDAGLIHRDVKPRNIVLEPSGNVRLIDFGLAAPADPMGHGSAGTPGYAPPEQLRSPAQVDARSDLYAVGQVLLECLSGCSPAAREEDAASGGSGSWSSLDSSRFSRWRGLESLLAGLLADAPDERYPDARSLLRELELVRSGQVVCGPSAYEASPKRRAALVGRESELARLGRAWSRARTRRGTTLAIEAARGGGKTSLLTAFASTVREAGTGRVLLARCRDRDPPLALLRRIFDEYMAAMGRASPDRRAADEAALREAASGPLAGFATLIAPKLSTVLGDGSADVEPAPGGFAEGAAEIIRRLARGSVPLLICVDDVQWIDPISRQVLLRIAERAPELSLLLVLATRTPAEGALFSELDSKRTARIELHPLSETQIGDLVAAHLGEAHSRPELARRIAALSDGTPLGVFEVLGAMLDLGTLRPQDGGWALDSERLGHMVLPDRSLALLHRRLSEVPVSARRILESAALLGAEFDDDLLARVLLIEDADLRDALAEGRRAGLIEGGERGSHCFVHDSAREMLISGMGDVEARRLHSSIARVLDVDASNAEALYAAASHYAAGNLEEDAGRAYPAARAAAESALRRFDNETALTFLDLARRAADLDGVRLDANFHRSAGEAHLRLGALEESLRAYIAALETETDRTSLAAIHARIAWVEGARGNPDRAWAALDRAFTEIGARMPADGVASAARTLHGLASIELRQVARRALRLGRASTARIELLCDLLYQTARLSLEYGRPQRFIASALLGMRWSARLGPCRQQTRVRCLYGFVLISIGLREAGARELARAASMASELGDPITIAYCTQFRAVYAALSGDLEFALKLFLECVDVHAPWLEANEYCLDAATGELIESLRGRAAEAWAWISRAIERQRRGSQASLVFDQVLLHQARACLASLGQKAEPGSWLAMEFDRMAGSAAPLRGLHRLRAWGARARAMVDSGELGPPFDAFVEEFESEGHDPRTIHLSVGDYYVAVAHGRIHQFLRALPDQREARMLAVEKALVDLKAVAKIPLGRAHALFVEGFVATFRGAGSEGQRLFADAEALATKENAPWVLYAVARARAHRLRDEGKLGAAQDQARIAETLAREHGAEPRASWVREEFGLPNVTPADRPTLPTSEGSAPNSASRQLSALLRLVRSPDLRPEEQARTMLDDLLRDLDADRGLIWFQRDAGAGSRLLLGRSRRGDEWSETEAWRAEWLESVRQAGRAWPPPEARESIVAFGQKVDPLRLLAAPLFLADTAVGATCLERSAGAPAFSREERELLVLLSRQIPISLEISHLFVEREQLHASLQQAQKMEAVGQLAGGIAHDFNNMLMAIRASLDLIERQVGSNGDLAAEVAIIADTTQRAGRLMRQLLGFSRHQAASQRLFSVNDLIVELRPMLERLAGGAVKVVLDLDPEAEEVMIVRSSFDQAMVNLVVNARDAMPDGGSLTITTRDAVLDEVAMRQGAPRTGPHVAVRVSDTGQGIRPEHISQVFDPFFTTKAVGNGTGLGLTTVYAFMRNSGGHLDVTSAVEQGTTISLFFPAVDASALSVPAGHSGVPSPGALSNASSSLGSLALRE
jgi:eukaryotic-like serine/threonine-protein kinase